MTDMFEQIYDALNVQVVTLIEQSKSINAQNEALRDALAEKTRQCLRKDDRIAELERQLSEMEESKAVPVPCSERMPGDNIDVLVYVNGHAEPFVGYRLLGKWHVSEAHFTHDGKDWCEVISQADCTHWLPFPKAPTWDDMPIHASAPAQGVAEPVAQKFFGYLTPDDAAAVEQIGYGKLFISDKKHGENWVALYTAPQPADTDKLREAIRDVEVSTSGSKGYAKAFNDGAETMREAISGIADDLAGQAPVRGVPEGWQPIETAPKDGREVLLQVALRAGVPGKQLVGHWMPGGHCIEDHPPIAAGWYFFNGSIFDIASKPLYWMPLPASPIAASMAAVPAKESK